MHASPFPFSPVCTPMLANDIAPSLHPQGWLQLEFPLSLLVSTVVLYCRKEVTQLKHDFFLEIRIGEVAMPDTEFRKIGHNHVPPPMLVNVEWQSAKCVVERNEEGLKIQGNLLSGQRWPQGHTATQAMHSMKGHS